MRPSPARAALLALAALLLPAVALAQPQLDSASAVAADSVLVEFDRAVDPATAQTITNYLVYETANAANRLTISSASASGSQVTLVLATQLLPQVSYTLRVQGVQEQGGGAGMAPATTAFLWDVAPPITAISDIHTDFASYDGQQVTVEAQVFVPRYLVSAQSGRHGAWVQDDSGYGINLTGSEVNDNALSSQSNVVRVTGTVGSFESTLQLESITQIQLLSSGVTPRSPVQLSTAAANDARWESTYIQVTGTVQSSSVGGPARNYVVDDGSGSIVVRVLDVTGVPTIPDGNVITAAGAGSQFSGTFQLTVAYEPDLDPGDITPPPTGITPIADIHADLSSYLGQVVTIRAQPYLPADYTNRFWDGYAQDSSGRGLNIFNFDPPPNGELAYDTGNILDITGTVTLFGDTKVEVADVSAVTLVSSGNPPLQPVALSIPAASSPQWEGTYIQVTGEIASKFVTGSAPHTVTNYTITDTQGNTLVIRVDDDVLETDYPVGTVVWGQGAGSQFGDDYQVLVGLPEGFRDTPPPDLSPPTLLAALLLDPTRVELRFSEGLDASTASDPGNYTVASGSDTVAVVSASASGSTANLMLASPIVLSAGWQVTVVGVADLAGNTITQPQTVTIAPAPAEFAALDGPARTFLPRLGEGFPVTMTVPPGFLDGSGLAEIQLRAFDQQGRLVATLYDSRFVAGAENDFDNPSSSHTVEWDGLDEVGEFVPAGSYVVHLAVVNPRTGNRDEAQMPVVVATRLDR